MTQRVFCTETEGLRLTFTWTETSAGYEGTLTLSTKPGSVTSVAGSVESNDAIITLDPISMLLWKLAIAASNHIEALATAKNEHSEPLLSLLLQMEKKLSNQEVQS